MQELRRSVEIILRSNLQLSNDSYALLIRQITSSKCIPEGKSLHAHIRKQGADHDTFLGNLLIDMYSKFGQLDEATQAFDRIRERNIFSWNIHLAANAQNGHLLGSKDLFDKMPVRNTVSWSSMVGAYAQYEQGVEAIRLFREMHLEGARPDRITFMNVLDACADIPSLPDGIFVNRLVEENGLETDVKVGTALVNMYGKSGSLSAAKSLFERLPERNIVSWNALLTGFSQNGEISQARNIFTLMPERNAVSWSGMVSGYAQNGHSKQALELLPLMDVEGIHANENTFIAALDACASLSALSQGRTLHARVASVGLDSKLKVATCVLEMYGKCGRVEEARAVFESMGERSVVTWNAMLGSYARFGHWRKALGIFLDMILLGFIPTWVTYTGVLVACSHSGLLKQGTSYFRSMISDFSIEPTIEHYHCMVDLIARSGGLTHAEELVHNMPFHSNAVSWSELVASSKLHGDLSKCERAAENTFEIDPSDPSHLLLSNMYAAAGRQVDVRRVRKSMKERGVKSRPGCSFIEVSNKVHEFVSGDTVHPMNERIREMNGELHEMIAREGYVPDTKEVLHDVEEKVKRKMLRFHSEKMAISFGVVVTKPGTPLRVVKNLRVCVDCHTFTKLVSRCLGREIVMRDVNRFHCFAAGKCSCNDYW